MFRRMNSSFTPLRSAQTWLVLIWWLSAAAVVVSFVGGWPAVLVLGLLVNYVADTWIYLAAPAASQWMGGRQLGSIPRAAFRQTFAVAGWVLIAAPPVWAVVVALLVLGLMHLSHFGYRVISSRNLARRAGRFRWANLDVDGESAGPDRLPPTLPPVGAVNGSDGVGGPNLLRHVDIVWLLGLLAAGLLDAPLVVVAAGVITLGLCAAALTAVARRYFLIQRLPTPAKGNQRLLAVAEALSPRVAVYFSGPRGSTYQLNVWLETIDRLQLPTIIIVREAHHLDTMLACTTPVVVLPTAQNVESLHLPSLQVVLYPTTVINNNHMIRLRGVKHVFINHGDGDKSVTYSPLHRVFDEIWVAGQAACDRYLLRGEGIRADQLRQVGRPQLASITRAAEVERSAEDVVTVLYAPTWEGNFDDVNYSSVATMGPQIIEQLLNLPTPVRILFKPHPATGVRLPAAAESLRVIKRWLKSTPGHVLVASEPTALYDAFNACDVLISDVSSVVADFLASRKPYLMTNPRDIDAEAYHELYPSTSGGGLIAADTHNLVAEVLEAVGDDRHRTRRYELADYFLGAPTSDPIGEFAREVDRACEEIAADDDATADRAADVAADVVADLVARRGEQAELTA